MKVKEVISEVYRMFPITTELTKNLFAIEDIKFKEPFITEDIFSDIQNISVEKPVFDLIIYNNTYGRVKLSHIRNINVSLLRHELAKRSGLKLRQQEILLPYFNKMGLVNEDEYKVLMEYFYPRIIRTFSLRVYHESENNSNSFRDNFLKYYSNVTRADEFEVIRENLELLVSTFSTYLEEEIDRENKEYEEFLNREL